MNKVLLFPQTNNEAIVKPFLIDLYSDSTLASTYFNNRTRPTSMQQINNYIDDLLAWSQYHGYIIIHQGMMVGEVGYLTDNSAINVILDSRFQGKGLAKEAVKQIMELFPNKTFTATILSDNIASVALFTSLGFTKVGRDDYYELDIYTLEKVNEQT